MTGNGVFGRFADSRGNTFDLLEGHRDSLKPEWRAMLKSWGEYAPPSPDAIGKSAEQARSSVRSALSAIGAHGVSLEGKRVIEVGCHNGARCFALAAEGAFEMTGSDIPAYYILQGAGVEVSEDTLEEQRKRLSSLRTSLGDAEGGGRVRFVEDDICASSLPDEAFDLVCSWDLLEHVREPRLAFSKMARVLRHGGIAFHEYNPFFSLDGGHSLCTLDFPWGHARLCEADFLRYLGEVRPDEAESAGRFYRFNLNRMTLAECEGHVRAAGFETLAFLAPTHGAHLVAASPEILRQVSELHPSATIPDLGTPVVRLILRKP